MNFCKPNQAHEDEKCTFFPSVPSLIFHFPHSELHLAIFQFHFVVALIHFPHSPQNEIMYHFPCPFKAVLLGCISAGQVPAVPCFSMLDYFSGKEGNFIIFKILNCGHLYGGGCTLKCIPVKWQCHQICRIELRETVGKNKKTHKPFQEKECKMRLIPIFMEGAGASRVLPVLLREMETTVCQIARGLGWERGPVRTRGSRRRRRLSLSELWKVPARPVPSLPWAVPWFAGPLGVLKIMGILELFSCEISKSSHSS